MDNYQALQVGVYGGRGNVIPYGPGMPYVNEAAVLAALPVGSLVYDMAETVVVNRMKRIRYVAELNGSDMIIANSSRYIAEAPFYQFIFRDVTPGVSSIGRIARIINGTTLIVFLYVDISGKLNVQIRQSDGSTVIATVVSTSTVFTDGKFHKLGVEFTTTQCSIFVDGVFDKSGTISGWNVSAITRIELYDADPDIRPLQVANIKVTSLSPIIDCWELSEYSGTVFANKCNPSNPATLSDATARAKACVPIALDN